MSFSVKSDRLKVNFLISVFWCVLTIPLSAQYVVSGQVLDYTSQTPLPFVNVIINDDGRQGTNTDIQGRFHFESKVPVSSLTFSFVGYDKVVTTISPFEPAGGLIIYLEPSEVALNEIVVHAGENPANRIIREVIRNKDLNHPEKISSFKYTSYNKVIYDIESGEAEMADTTFQEIKELFKGGHMMIMESVTERKYVHPNHSEETVLGTKVSGFKSASFAPLATDIQPFSFYEDYIKVIDVDYLNPISQGSLSRYEFHIRDTLFHGVDTTYILSFKPLPGKNFEGLTGLLYINTRQYAIQNVIAEPAEPGFIDVTIQQQYQCIDQRVWFPEQLKFELFFRGEASSMVGVKASGTSFIKDVQLYADIDRRRFSVEEVILDPLATKRDSLFWTGNRPVPLDEKEATTYVVMDSLGEKIGFDKALKLTERLGEGKIPVGFVDIDFNKFILYNKYEGIRLGLGLYTNDQWIKNISIGGYGGYGFKDHTWKYGAEMIAYLNASRESTLNLGYHNTLRETGKSSLGLFRPRRFDYRSFLASQMDHIEQWTGTVNFRTMRYAKMSVGFNRYAVEPKYDYAFQPNDMTSISNYVNTEATVVLRYAYKERLMNFMGQRLSMGTKFPVLTMAYTHGWQGVLEGMFDYDKVECQVEYTLPVRNFGKSNILVNAGYINSPIPYGMLFTGEGSFLRNWSVLVKNSFMTAPPYEFLSDRYVHFHYSHDFGSLLFHIGKWKPSISVYQNAGWGSLAHPEYHQGIQFKTKEKGLYESGFQIDNLVRFKYLNVSYIGFGAGAFARYGPYATGHFKDDVVFTFSMTFSTK